jgi:hypothetical protein
MKEAFELAWPCLVFAFTPNSREAHMAQECLASRILEVVAEGEVNVRPSYETRRFGDFLRRGSTTPSP